MIQTNTMKRQLTLLSLFAAFVFCCGFLHAQSCEPYYPLREGAKFEMTSYDDKDKVQGYQRHEVLSVESSGDHLEAQLRVTYFDKKEKEGFTMDYNMVCEDNVFQIDMRSMMPASSGGSMEMDMTVEADNLEFPSSLETGMELKDAHLKVSMAATMGISVGGISVDITDRKVTARESVTTPAGTFDCHVLSQHEESRVMGIKVTGDSKAWYSKGVGLVRSESYNKKGALTGYMLLTQLER